MCNQVIHPDYPSYVDFDSFVDVARLVSLNGFIRTQIEHHIALQKDSFFLNQHRLDDATPYRPGVREIWLSQTPPDVPYNYMDLDKPNFWIPTDAADEFKPVTDFIATLPFSRIGRILIIYDDGGNAVPAHRDHTDPNVCHEFIWMRTNCAKRFFVLDASTGTKRYIESNSAWFDSVNQFHGADASDQLSFSIRVDGVFSDSLRQHIPFPKTRRSSAPAIWARALATGATTQSI